MKSPLTLAAVLLAVPILSLHGDGPPVDVATRSMTVPHEKLVLSASQREEIEVLGTLTLEPSQWERVRRSYPAMPKRIEHVLPVTYNDCMCDIGVYAIQLDSETVAVAHEQYAEEGTFETSLVEGKELSLRVDHRGQFYFKGGRIPFQKLLDAIRDSKPAAGEEEAWLLVEFPLDVTRMTKEVASRIKLLSEAGKGAGWTVHLDDSVREG